MSCSSSRALSTAPLEPSTSPLEPSTAPLEPSAAPLEHSTAHLEPSTAPKILAGAPNHEGRARGPLPEFFRFIKIFNLALKYFVRSISKYIKRPIFIAYPGNISLCFTLVTHLVVVEFGLPTRKCGNLSLKSRPRY